MSDLLVKLYELPPLEPLIAEQAAKGITIRRGLSPEKHLITAWIKTHFQDFWVSECEAAFAHDPISCFVAVEAGQLLGFACYNTTAKAFFGPTGVGEAARGRGTGKALLLVCLHALWHEGYVYGIIGDAGPVDFYARTVGAVEIPDSSPGIYKGMLGYDS